MSLNGFPMPKSICALITILTLSSLQSCSRDILADPMCRVNKSLADIPPAPAACLIKLNKKLLAVQLIEQSSFTLPFEKQSTQTAQCTAHQGVWKSTGLNIEVNQLLFVGADNTHYFACKANGQFSSDQTSLPVPAWATHKIAHIRFINPFASTKDEWSRSIDLIKLREAFTQLPENERILIKGSSK